ncbi:MAG TPA: type VI secretion system-associated protein TagF [Polyangiaceae bacterium]|nr:type VI secretion system-associated protein TagF [Polyangiaceae bacterium]
MPRAAIGLVGKLPASADFLRVQAQTEVFQTLLGWMLDGVQGAAARPGGYAAEGQPGADADGVLAFCYKSRKGTTALGGALAPSMDQAGRRFPIAAASELVLDAELGEHPEALPLVLETVWATSSQLVVDLRSVDRATLDATPLAVDVDTDVNAALAAYRGWTRDLELDDFIALVFGGDMDHAAAAFALAEEAARPYVGVENPDTPLALRLPLGQAGGAAVCFWLDLVVRLTGWRRTVPSFFWSHDGAAGALMLHLGRVTPAVLPELWLPTGRSDEVCDVVAPPRSFRSPQTSRWERIIAEPDQAVSELLRAAAAKTHRT